MKLNDIYIMLSGVQQSFMAIRIRTTMLYSAVLDDVEFVSPRFNSHLLYVGLLIPSRLG